MQSPLLTVEQLSACIRKSVASIRSDVTRNPHSIPPICRLPGTKRLLWRPEDVREFLARNVARAEVVGVKDGIDQQSATLPKPKKMKRGRPTKVETVRRAASSRSTQEGGETC